MWAISNVNFCYDFSKNPKTEFNIADLKSYVLRELATKIDESNDEKEGHNGKIDNGYEASIFVDEANRNGLLNLYNDEHSESYKGGNNQRVYENLESIDISRLKNNKLVELARNVLKNGENILSGSDLKEFLQNVLKKKQGAVLDAEIKELVKNNSSQTSTNVATNNSPAPANTESIDDINVIENTANNTKEASFVLPKGMNLNNLKNQELKDLAKNLFGDKTMLDQKDVKILYNQAMLKAFNSDELYKSFKKEFINTISNALPESLNLSEIKNPQLKELAMKRANGRDTMTPIDLYDLRIDAANTGLLDVFDDEMDTIKNGAKPRAATAKTSIGGTSEVKSQSSDSIAVDDIQNPTIKKLAEKFFPGVKSLNASQIETVRAWAVAGKIGDDFDAEMARINNNVQTTATAKVNNTASAASSAVNSNGVLELECNTANKNMLRSGNMPEGTNAIRMNGITHYKYEDCPANQRTNLNGVTVHKDLVEPFKTMQKAALRNGVDLNIVSGFRPADYQKAVFSKKFGSGNPTDQAFTSRLKESAPPGFSEHHTGLAVDVCSVDPKAFQNNEKIKKAGQWLKAHAAEFGFEISFPENNSQGLIYEPWHLRYVGSSEAKEIFKAARNEN